MEWFTQTTNGFSPSQPNADKRVKQEASSMNSCRCRVLLACLTISLSISLSQQQSISPVPPNAPALVELKNEAITIQYNGRVIFSGRVNAGGVKLHERTQVYAEGQKVQQVILLTTMDWNKKIKITGTVAGSEESFPCEADRPPDRASQGPMIVRHASGIGRNLRNRAVYDRKWDWAFSVDANPRVVIAPAELKESQNSFSIDIEGYEIVLRFRPHFFQQHRGLEFFEPWTYAPWRKSVAGWISWFAFFDKVSEQDMMETADVFSSALRPFGYEYFQMDDGNITDRIASDVDRQAGCVQDACDRTCQTCSPGAFHASRSAVRC